MRFVSLFVILLPLLAQHRIRVDSQLDQRSYIVNLDDRATLGKLRASGASAMPAWLVIPGSTPTIETVGERVVSKFQVAGAVGQTAEYYRQLLASQGYAVEAGGAGSVNGKRGTETISVTLTQKGEVVDVRIAAPARTSTTPLPANLESISYDDATGILLLKDKRSNETYALGREAIRASGGTTPKAPNAVSGGRIPSFVPIYPNGKIDRNYIPTNRPGEAELRILTHDTTDQAVAWYVRALAGAGFQETGSTNIGSGSSYMNQLTAVDASGAHAVKVDISASFQMPVLECEKPYGSEAKGIFSSIGKCAMTNPEKTRVTLTYKQLK